MIRQITTRDVRFPLEPGAGSDSVHRDPVYSYAVTQLQGSAASTGIGLTFTLGAGNDLVCRAAEHLAKNLEGQAIEEVMAHFGRWQREAADEQQFRWLGPHKGVVHLALASVTNACWDLWAKERGVPLWRLLLDLSPEQLVATLDLSYLEDVLTREEILRLLREQGFTRSERENILQQGYPCYDTSVGWFNYPDEQLRENCRSSLGAGFTAVKLKVGSPDMERDLRRLNIVLEEVGPEVQVMVDANQQWTLPRALEFGKRVSRMKLHWIEEPTHPDDILAHQRLAQAVAPTKLAAGEHIPNRVVFKNYMQAGGLGFCQVDALRVAGVSEFIVVSLLAKKFGIPVVPHAGDMGQLHQHLVRFNHIALGHEAHFLEHIPHLQEKFVHPFRIEGGINVCPQTPGASCDLIET